MSAIRKNARLRREYLYRKSLEGKEKELYEKKRRIREALQEGKALPTEFIAEADRLREELALDDEEHGKAAPTSHVDDEYAHAGEKDPVLLITTSRDPSSRLKQFAKELKLVFPNAERINRGAMVVKDVVDLGRRNDVTDIVVCHEHRGEPDGLVISHLPYGPTAYFSLSGCVMRHDIAAEEGSDIGHVSEAYPHLVFDKFDSKLGERVSNILKHLFPVPKLETKRVITFANDRDSISFRHHTWAKTSHTSVELQEVGPRFEMSLYQVKLGTIDLGNVADDEWVLRPYMNTSRTRQAL